MTDEKIVNESNPKSISFLAEGFWENANPPPDSATTTDAEGRLLWEIEMPDEKWTFKGFTYDTVEHDRVARLCYEFQSAKGRRLRYGLRTLELLDYKKLPPRHFATMLRKLADNIDANFDEEGNYVGKVEL